MNIYLFWLIQLTWGFPINLIGLFVSLFGLCFGIKPKKFQYGIYFEFGKSWGGVNFGGFFFVQKGANLSLKRHEYGHSIQTLFLGPFMLFIVTIPSAIRYHYRNFKHSRGYILPPYDDFWCERWATELGRKHYQSEEKISFQ